jgi:hypothetical protein
VFTVAIPGRGDEVLGEEGVCVRGEEGFYCRLQAKGKA